MGSDRPQLEFIVGEERKLSGIISSSEINPLLCSLVKAGPVMASVLDEDGLPLCRSGSGNVPGEHLESISLSLTVEGEPQGTLVVVYDPVACPQAGQLTQLACDAIQLTLNNNLKRMLTTEMHTSIVQESYDQLVQANKMLTESEGRYRDLALSLERKVEERTAELKKAYVRMLQQEKLAAVGSLAAGMAHEINNPNGFVRSNLSTLNRYVTRMKEMLAFYQQQIVLGISGQMQKESADRKLRELKMDYILSDADDLLKQSIEGTERIARMIADLKGFSHVDESGESDADLNQELERVMNVLSAQIEPDTVVVRDLQPLPLAGCNPGLISQAFLNIIQNAILSRKHGLILGLSSRNEDGQAVIAISDNGCGIPEENLSRVFEPFFTTREVGSGTGMGLTMVREIISSAGGSIEVASILNSGTTVTVRIPCS